MKLKIAVLIIVISSLFGCGSKPPSGDQIVAALTKLAQKDNPGASVKLKDIGMSSDKKATDVKFECLNCAFVDSSGAKKIVPTSKGEATVWKGPTDSNYKFQEAFIVAEGGLHQSFDFIGYKFE